MNFIKEENRIYLEENNKVIAEITYEKVNNNTYNINHTFVDESLRGQGIARQLVEQAIEEIRKKGYNVEATCSYASKYLENKKNNQ